MKLTLWLSVQLRPTLASFTNSWRVDQRSELLHDSQISNVQSKLFLSSPDLDIVRQQAVEKVEVGVAEDREVLVLLNVRLLLVENGQR